MDNSEDKVPMVDVVSKELTKLGFIKMRGYYFLNNMQKVMESCCNQFSMEVIHTNNIILTNNFILRVQEDLCDPFPEEPRDDYPIKTVRYYIFNSIEALIDGVKSKLELFKKDGMFDDAERSD